MGSIGRLLTGTSGGRLAETARGSVLWIGFLPPAVAGIFAFNTVASMPDTGSRVVKGVL
jgi:hypothetical protein